MNDLLQFSEVSLLLGIFIIKKCVLLFLTSFGTLKYDWLINTKDMFNFKILIVVHDMIADMISNKKLHSIVIELFIRLKSSVTIDFSFLLLIISAIISSKTINILFSLSGL